MATHLAQLIVRHLARPMEAPMARPIVTNLARPMEAPIARQMATYLDQMCNVLPICDQ
jgi:hypothetical protein